ncbi:type II toxin-antitoxin system PemK/MazF family toxin [Legionella sp.]|uniref:type II toxin-antitoxin system PemK/MazF family toxin n=1 Tax=Legionella sp. TaxID=459 RepID=UPI003D0A2C64
MMNRGEVYWVNLDPTTGSEINKLRPCVLVGATPINQARRTMVVVPLSTSATARPPITISVSCLGKQVTAVCDQIRTIDKNRLKNMAGSLSDKDLNALDDGLRQILCL